VGGRQLASKECGARYVLDGRREPVPVGVNGEIYVGGAGVGRGYWNRVKETAEEFVPDPFSVEEGRRIYGIGEMGKWQGDGEIE